jgi:hypothetical protein
MGNVGPFDTKALAEQDAQAEVDEMRTKGSIGGFHIRVFELGTSKLRDREGRSSVRSDSAQLVRAEEHYDAVRDIDRARVHGDNFRRVRRPAPTLIGDPLVY